MEYRNTDEIDSRYTKLHGRHHVFFKQEIISS